MSAQAHVTVSDLEQATFAVDVRDGSPNGRGINEGTTIWVCFTLKSGPNVGASTTAKIKTPYASLMHQLAGSAGLQGRLRSLLLSRCRSAVLTDKMLFDTLGLMV